MSDRTVWSDLILEVVMWPFLRMRSENMAHNPIEVGVFARILLLYWFSTMPNRMSWSDLKSELVRICPCVLSMWLKMPTISFCSWKFIKHFCPCVLSFEVLFITPR
jgi:hypothetical protein